METRKLANENSNDPAFHPCRNRHYPDKPMDCRAFCHHRPLPHDLHPPRRDPYEASREARRPTRPTPLVPASASHPLRKLLALQKIPVNTSHPLREIEGSFLNHPSFSQRNKKIEGSRPSIFYSLQLPLWLGSTRREVAGTILSRLFNQSISKFCPKNCSPSHELLISPCLPAGRLRQNNSSR